MNTSKREEERIRQTIHALHNCDHKEPGDCDASCNYAASAIQTLLDEARVELEKGIRWNIKNAYGSEKAEEAEDILLEGLDYLEYLKSQNLTPPKEEEAV